MAAPVDPSQATLKLENTEKRDTLRAIEKKYQKLWADQKIYESNAPTLEEYPKSTSIDEIRAKHPKFFGTMAYPYGHSFTVSKIEFASRVARAQGRKALYPQGYHCTGMPIRACADKLVRELELFGKNFDENLKDPEVAEAKPAAGEKTTDFSKFTNLKKGKAALKGAGAKYQYEVMLSIGVPREEIHKFADPGHWIEYFPEKWQTGLTDFGCSIDWRRSFVTTDVNPYYDSFVQWQMRRLKAQNKIQYGKRYTVYSPKDGQPCLDHDRQSGEGVLVQEYTAIKCKVKTWSEAATAALSGKLPSDANVYLVPATLRPETMYGQTNIFVSPKITYGIFKISENEYYLITNRAGRNMGFQSIFPTWGEFTKVVDISGNDVVGTVVDAPLSFRKEVYVLPMDTIKDGKGTGVVTSVPSDSPDDYAMTIELSKKAEFYKIKPEWVDAKDILPIIKTPTYGDLTAKTLVEQLKINSPKDAKQLLEAKELAYKEGFYQGVMVYGEFTGDSVQDAKPKVRQQLIDSKLAFNYAEPDGQVISRSGDECVAALLDQWYLAYGTGDPAWRDSVLQHVQGLDGQEFNPWSNETLRAIEGTLGWMHQWAVTRQYGLGTKLPWDQSQLVESLSDSTIYMAYYAVAPFLHSDIYGQHQGTGNIKYEQMTDDVWNFIFGLTSDIKSDIPQATLDAMRREFQYWYALDVRISGKDLINNHLIFFLYIHQAIWGEIAPQNLPKGIRMNGHLMLNGEKMSKSTGNFLTLSDSVEKFGADASRIALADAGDGAEDSNFDETVANAVILKIFELKKWIEDVVLQARVLKEGENLYEVKEVEKIKALDTIQRAGAKGFWDELFENELNTLVQEAVRQYDGMLYKNALKAAYYDLTSVRDTYRLATLAAGVGMHHDSVLKYVEYQAILLAPIAPHWSDYIWQEVLKKPSTVTLELFPKVSDPVPSLTAASTYVKNVSSNIGSEEGNQAKKMAKGKTTQYDPKKEKKLKIFVATSWPAWQSKYIDIVRSQLESLGLVDLKEATKKVDKPDMKKALPFIKNIKTRLEAGEAKDAVLERKLEFDEISVLREMAPGLKSSVPKLVDIVVIKIGADGKTGEDVLTGEKVESIPPVAGNAVPGHPSFEFTNI